MDSEKVEVGMHIIRPSNQMRGVVVGEAYANDDGVWMAPVFYINEQQGPYVSKTGWFVVHFEPDPDPPHELWSMYCARVLQGVA